MATDIPQKLLTYPPLNCSISYSLPAPFLNLVCPMQACRCWGFNVIFCVNLIIEEIWTSYNATYSFPILKAPKSKYFLTPFCISQSRPSKAFLLRFFTTKKSWLTPTSHFLVFYWLQFTSMRCLFPTGYLPKPTSMGGRICHHLLSSTTSIGQGDIPLITLLILSSAGWSCQQHPPMLQHLQGMVTFR